MGPEADKALRDTVTRIRFRSMLVSQYYFKGGRWMQEMDFVQYLVAAGAALGLETLT
jgi:hypothetical protein